MKSALFVVVVLAIVAVGVWSIPSGYSDNKTGTPGIKHVQHQKPDFVAGVSGDTLAVNDDSYNEGDIQSEAVEDYLPPSNDYLPPTILDDARNEESVSLKGTEDVNEEAIADEESSFGDETTPFFHTDDSPADNVEEPSKDVPTIENTRESKQVPEETPVYGYTEERAAEEAVEEANISTDEEKVSDDDGANTPVDDPTLLVDEPIPVVKDIPVSVAPTKKRVVFLKKPSAVPQSKKVFVQLQEEDENSVEYKPARKDEAAEEEEEQSAFPLGGTFFPIDFGGSSGPTGAVAIANSFSTARGGSSKSFAVAYGSGKGSFGV